MRNDRSNSQDAKLTQPQPPKKTIVILGKTYELVAQADGSSKIRRISD